MVDLSTGTSGEDNSPFNYQCNNNEGINFATHIVCTVMYHVTCVELHYLHYHKGIVQANEDNRPTSIVESNIQHVANRTGKSFFWN